MADDIYGRTVARVFRQNDAQLKPLGDLALTRLNATGGEHIVDIGCGAAQTCLQIAEAVGPAGSVLGVDVSPILASLAAERTRSTPQTRIVEGNAEKFAFAPSYYHAVFSRFGVMAFADSVRAFSNFRAALRPEGRLTFVCWRSFAENEIDHLPFRASAGCLSAEDLQGVEAAAQFSFSDADHIRQVLLESGFVGIDVEAHDVSVSAGDVESTLELCLSVGALGAVVRRKPGLRDLVEGPVRKVLDARARERDVFMNAAVWVVAARVP